MKIMDSKYVVADPETLREACIAHNWFTCGSNEQYNKMFEANRITNGYTTVTIADIALIIWVCSEKGDTRDDIYDKLLATHREYLVARQKTAKFKLQFYHTVGPERGNREHEEFFDTRDEMTARYQEVVAQLGTNYRACRPTAWSLETGGRIVGY